MLMEIPEGSGPPMSTNARMIATDLDGTLLRPDSTVSPRTLAALVAARQAGLIVTLVTGRPPRWLAPVVHQTGWHGLAVAANGAVLIDLEERRIEQTYPIPRDDLLAAVAAIRDLLPGASFATEYVHAGAAVPVIDPLAPPEDADAPASFGHEPGYRSLALKMPHMPATAPIEELIEEGNVVKLLARGPAEGVENPDATMHRIADALAGLVTVTHSTTQTVLLEISRSDTSKATGLEALARHHNIRREDVIAIGDMPNDLPMLQWAGTGLAVGNAHPRVLADVGSNNILPTNTDDGVASVIEGLLSEAPE